MPSMYSLVASYYKRSNSSSNFLNCSCFLSGPTSKACDSFFFSTLLGEAGAFVFLMMDLFKSEYIDSVCDFSFLMYSFDE